MEEILKDGATTCAHWTHVNPWKSKLLMVNPFLRAFYDRILGGGRAASNEQLFWWEGRDLLLTLASALVQPWRAGCLVVEERHHLRPFVRRPDHCSGRGHGGDGEDSKSVERSEIRNIRRRGAARTSVAMEDLPRLREDDLREDGDTQSRG